MSKMTTETDVPVPMRDGLRLSANVYRPEDPGQYPVIMAFTAFGKDDYWSEKNPGWGIEYEPNSPTTTGSITFEANDPAFWVPNGYILVIVDPRGYGKSPGRMQTAEVDGQVGEQALLYQGVWARDMYDAIEWAGIQAWSDGNVGLSGVSILGFSQWRVAGMNPPHLRAINPWEAMTDFYRDVRFPGGIPETSFTNPGGVVSSGICPHDPAWPSPESEDAPAPIEKEEDQFLSEISLPTLICGSWSGHGIHTRGSFRAFRKISSEHKFLYTHGRQEWAEFYTAEARTVRKLFFDHFLKGADTRILDMPPVRLEVRENLQKYSIRHESDFPIPRTRYERFYLDAADGGLTSHASGRESKVNYQSDTGKAGFDLTFDGDTELTGYMSLKLWVSPEDGEDLDMFVTVRKLDGKGDEVHFDSWASPGRWPVALGWLRLSYRELEEDKSTPWEPYLKRVAGPGSRVRPGEIVPCEIPILPSSTLFRARETLRVEISGEFRGGEKLPVPHAFSDVINRGTCSIYTGGRFDSHLVVPVVPRR